jgi:hypothetical protein
MQGLHDRWWRETTVGVIASCVLASGCGSEPPSASSGSARGTASPTTGAVASPSPTVVEDGPQPGYEQVRFSDPTRIDNQWLPLQPGTQLVLEGESVEDGEHIPHRTVTTVTDLTKEIDGVHTVVVWDRDYQADELVEAELAFFAQADDGDIWHFGQYPEEYEDGKFVDAPAFIHGIQDAQAGIMIKADYQIGDPSHSQGWGPEVDWTDRAHVEKVGQRTCVQAGCYDDVLVVGETSKDEPGAVQFKYYAAGVGNVQVGFGGDDPTQETLELVKVVQLTPQEIETVRAEALKLEQSAYQRSKDVYGHTAPISAAGQA